MDFSWLYNEQQIRSDYLQAYGYSLRSGQPYGSLTCCSAKPQLPVSPLSESRLIRLLPLKRIS